MLVSPVATEIKLLQQIQPVGLINATTVTCCTCTMALFCIQSTLEVVLMWVQNILIFQNADSFKNFEPLLLTPITDRYLGFNSVQNAYIYGITGGTATLVMA